ncbi:haloacid dehalogenase [Niastella koreensis]|uniref:Haloacid dehalogenase domain protein hydrolase n=2 Tax=Niastella koreensis TaxID=354356 RepID=G8T7T2_NIAKG|nr:HAD family hydrolase [Niastella koreensis]AEW03376.1 Haloacid dehalogenase domain protein hydrolase [Niastella koreensis GR20-10]OQP55657.1 haloacid dehalogenase [Niastella koreensis]
MKKAIIFDLDNTIYSVYSIGETLFAPLFELLEQDGTQLQHLSMIKDEVMRRPFQHIAHDYQFSDELTAKSLALLQQLVINIPIEPFEDFVLVRQLPIDKYLVTTGFPNMQQSKVNRMGLQKDFKEIHIVDPATSNKTKKEVFADIIRRHQYAKGEVLVIGDDLQSEIKAAQELGLDVVWYDKYERYEPVPGLKKIVSYQQLLAML